MDEGDQISWKTGVRIPAAPLEFLSVPLDMGFIRLNCNMCKRPFDKPLNEYNRCVKRGQTRFYCGQSCQVRMSNRLSPRKGDVSRLNPGNTRDELTPFRWFIARARYRTRHMEQTDLTAEYLRILWTNQHGLCPFTNQPMFLPNNTRGFEGHHSRNASVDRIDNTRGYVQGNVRFVSLIANYARSDFSDEDVFVFCRMVSEAMQ